MILPQYSRIIYRRVNIFFVKEFKALAGVAVMLLVVFAVIETFQLESAGLGRAKVLGEKNSSRIDTRVLLNESADYLASGYFKEAEKKLKTILEFEPSNKYAIEMLSKTDLETSELYLEVSRTLEILDKQPDWKTAWERLSYLYERLGDQQLANVARERAKKLKTT